MRNFAIMFGNTSSSVVFNQRAFKDSQLCNLNVDGFARIEFKGFALDDTDIKSIFIGGLLDDVIQGLSVAAI